MHQYKMMGLFFLISLILLSQKQAQKHRGTIEAPLSYTPPGNNIRMSMDEHRAIFVAYFCLLFSATILPFLKEILHKASFSKLAAFQKRQKNFHKRLFQRKISH